MLVWARTGEMTTVIHNVERRILLLRERAGGAPSVKTEPLSPKAVEGASPRSGAGGGDWSQAFVAAQPSSTSSSSSSSSLQAPSSAPSSGDSSPRLSAPLSSPRGRHPSKHFVPTGGDSEVAGLGVATLPPIGAARDRQRREGEPCCIAEAAGFERFPLEQRWRVKAMAEAEAEEEK